MQSPRVLQALLLTAACSRDPTLEEVLDNFVSQSSLDFEDCGAAAVGCQDNAPAADFPDFEQARACLLDAWNDCRPARAALGWLWAESDEGIARRVFIVPDDGSCRVVLFEDHTYTVDRLECDVLVAMGECGVIDWSACALADKIVIDPPSGG